MLPEHADSSSQAVDWQGSQGHDAIIHFLDFTSREISGPYRKDISSEEPRLEMRAREHVGSASAVCPCKGNLLNSYRKIVCEQLPKGIAGCRSLSVVFS